MGVVCVVGSINLDVMVRVDRNPEVGETVLGEAVARLPGGKGFNQAVAAGRSGADTRFCGSVGEDPDGAFLRRALLGAGLGDAFLSVGKDLPTGMAHVAMLPESGNSIIVSQGANAALSARAAATAVDGADVVLAQLEVPASTVEAALAAGRAAGALTVLNAAPTTAFTESLLAHVDVLVVNETEAAALGGVDALLDAGPRSVIVTLGSRGSRWKSRAGDDLRVPAFAVDAVDTTGAGDAFCGALAAALGAGASMPEAMERASAAGALVAMDLGAQTDRLSVESLAELVATR